MLTQTASTPTVLTLAAIVEQPTEETLKLIAQRIAPRTLGNYKDTLRLYHAWLAGRAPSDTNLANYLADRHRAGQAPGSLALVVNAVRWCEREGEAQGELVGKLSRDTLAGIRREGKGQGRWSTTGPQPRPGYPLWLMRPSAPIPRPGPETRPCCW